MAKTVSIPLKPLRDHIVVRALGREEVTAAGILLPDTASKEKPQEGEVIACGPGKMSDDGKVNLGLARKRIFSSTDCESGSKSAFFQIFSD